MWPGLLCTPGRPVHVDHCACVPFTWQRPSSFPPDRGPADLVEQQPHDPVGERPDSGHRPEQDLVRASHLPEPGGDVHRVTDHECLSAAGSPATP
jgi:hypothetical protein